MEATVRQRTSFTGRLRRSCVRAAIGCRILHDRCLRSRSGPRSALEVVIRPRHTEAKPLLEIDPNGPFLDLLRPPTPPATHRMRGDTVLDSRASDEHHQGMG